MPTMLNAELAASRLGVSRQTLYAYVSRGLVVAYPSPDGRSSLYRADAIEQLAGERKRGRRPKEVARATMDWGLPVLESRLTLISGGRLFYRGQDAAALAQHATLEAVAALLWDVAEEEAFTPGLPAPEPAYDALVALIGDTPLRDRLPALFAVAARDDATGSFQRDSRRLHAACGHLVRQMTAAVLSAPACAEPLHEQLARGYGLDRESAGLIRRALVLSADHELNASAFTARCIASTGASVRAAVQGGLAALSGPRHGYMTFRVEHFWNGLRPSRLSADVSERMAGGEPLPGFHHPLYPLGDIRAKVILAPILAQDGPTRAIVETVEALTGEQPSLDFALVALRRFLKLPDGAAFGLFAAARSVGWIAHALEQRAEGQLIRPRALYRGQPPEALDP